MIAVLISIIIILVVILLAVVVNMTDKFYRLSICFDTEYATNELLMATINQLKNQVDEKDIIISITNAYKVCVNKGIFVKQTDNGEVDYDKAAEMIYNEIESRCNKGVIR